MLCLSLIGASAWMALPEPRRRPRQTSAAVSRLPVAPQMSNDGLSAEFQVRAAPWTCAMRTPRTGLRFLIPRRSCSTRAAAARPALRTQPSTLRPTVPDPPLSQRLVSQRSGTVFGHPSEVLREQRVERSWVLIFNSGESDEGVYTLQGRDTGDSSRHGTCAARPLNTTARHARARLSEARGGRSCPTRHDRRLTVA